MDYFDRFSIFFSGDKLIAGRRTYPLGEITTELLNLKNDWFVELQMACSWQSQLLKAGPLLPGSLQKRGWMNRARTLHENKLVILP